MLNSWKKSTLPMPKRMEDLDLSCELEQQVVSASKSARSITSGTKILPKPMRTADLLKLFDFDSPPVVTKARKQLWSGPKSGSKKHNEKLKKIANKENVRKFIFPKTSTRRTSTVKSNAADQTLPLIDMEDLEENNPRKQKQPLRVPQSTVSNKTTVNPAAKRQTMYQTKFVKPAIKPSTETRSTSIHNPANTSGQNKLKRQTVHQSYALKSIPEITITKCNDTLDTGLSETVHESETESVQNILKQILSRMDKLERLIQEKKQCKCHCPCKQEPTNETKQENGISQENNTVAIVENIALCNNTIVENVTDTTEVKQTTDNISEKVLDNTVIEIKNIENSENVTEIVNEVLENVERNTTNDNKVSVPIFTFNSEEVPTGNLNAENMLHKSHFELLEDQLENNSLASLALIDSDDSASPAFQEIDYEYLLGENDGDVTVIHTTKGATTRNNSTGSNDAIRTYNEMRKCIPMLCTPKISRNNNASLMTPSVQNSHKKILSRRIQEQLLMLNKES